MLWTAGLTVVSSVLFGLVPALAFTSDAHGQPLHASRAGSLMLRSRRLQRGLVLSEVALSIVPLIAAGLMLRTFSQSSRGADRLRSRARRHREDLAQPRRVLDGRSPVGVLSGRDRTRARAARCRRGQRRRPTPPGAGADHAALLAKRGSRADAFDRHAAEHHARLLRGDGHSAARGPRHLGRRHPTPPARRRRRRAAGGAVVERRRRRQTAPGRRGESSRWRSSAWPVRFARARFAMPAPR